MFVIIIELLIVSQLRGNSTSSIISQSWNIDTYEYLVDKTSWKSTKK